jgi:hypothetical protein
MLSQIKIAIVLTFLLAGCSTEPFLPEVVVYSEVEYYGIWHQKFSLLSGTDSSFRETKTIDVTGPHLDLHDPDTLRKLWREYGDTADCSESEGVADGGM